MREHVVRDQHGNPLPPATGEPQVLGPDQVDDALVGLPGWERRGSTLFREFAVEPASVDALREGVRNAVGSECNAVVDEAEDRVRILLGTDRGDLTSAHLEAAARVDTVLSGSGSDRGTSR